MLSSLFGKSEQTPVRLVIGLNQVDKMIPDGWDDRLNMPTQKARVFSKSGVKKKIIVIFS